MRQRPYILILGRVTSLQPYINVAGGVKRLWSTILSLNSMRSYVGHIFLQQPSTYLKNASFQWETAEAKECVPTFHPAELFESPLSLKYGMLATIHS